MAGKWKCIYCGTSKGTINGVCPKCGPSQTQPLDDEARKEAGEVIKKEAKEK